MAEYYPLLSKAVSALRDGPPEKRQAIYDRARQALLTQLRSMEQANEELIERERRALDDAIGQLEMEIGMANVLGIGALPQTPVSAPSSPPSTPPRTPPRGDAAAGAVSAPVRPVPAPVRPPSARPAPAALPPRPYAVSPKSNGPSRPAPTPLREKDAAVGAPQPPLRAAQAEDEQSAVALPVAPRLELKPSETGKEPQSFDKALAEAEGVSASEGTDPTVKSTDQPVRPAAPRQPERKERLNFRVLIVGLVAALVVAGIGYTAWRLRDRPEALARALAAKRAAQSQEQQPGKVSNRADGSAPPTIAPDKSTDGEPAPQTPATTDSTTQSAPDTNASNPAAPSSATPSADTASSGDAKAPSQQDAAPSTPPASSAPPEQNQSAATTSSPTPDTAAVPVSQRAAFLVGAPNDANNVQTYVGTVVWSTAKVDATQGQAGTTAVRADVDIPDARLKLSMLIQKNTDDKVSASHMIELRFTPESGNSLGDIANIEVPAMRKDDAPVGDTLAGTRVNISTNYFWVGLSRGPAVARNIDLLDQRNWVDIPCLLANNRVAKITFEKGTPGAKMITDAIQSWQ